VAGDMLFVAMAVGYKRVSFQLDDTAGVCVFWPMLDTFQGHKTSSSQIRKLVSQGPFCVDALSIHFAQGSGSTPERHVLDNRFSEMEPEGNF
jgi:hypothetical protein